MSIPKLKKQFLEVSYALDLGNLLMPPAAFWLHSQLQGTMLKKSKLVTSSISLTI